MLDLAALDKALAGTIFAGHVHLKPVTGSTNADALEAEAAGAAHGSVFVADEQTAGRGRGDHSWISHPREGLYVSILMRLPIPALRMPLFPLAAGLAVGDAISSVSGLKADLRWPNDLLIGPAKVCGILAEARAEKGVARFAIAGIGINVHQQNFPAGLATPATSLDLASGKNCSRQDLLIALLKNFEREAARLLDDESAVEIPRRLSAASSWISGKRVAVHGPQACEGTSAGLDANGFLLVRTESGMVTVQTGGMRALND